MAKRLYLGRLPPDTRSEDVSKLFETYGQIVDCRVMTGFGFVEYETSKDAEDAVQNLNGKSLMGSNIVVEFAKEGRPRREPYEGDRGPTRSRRPPGFRIIVSGLSRDTSWQDLKDFGRDAGSVSFADIDRDTAGQGILEYISREDANRAMRDLDGKDLRGRQVRLSLDESRSGPDNYKRDDRRDDRYGRDERYDRGSRGGYRRDRSKSPPRRDDDRRSQKSPPPRRDPDDRKSNGHDDRRHDERKGSDYYERRRDDDKRRDDRRRDDRDDRYDERKPSNADSGWGR